MAHCGSGHSVRLDASLSLQRILKPKIRVLVLNLTLTCLQTLEKSFNCYEHKNAWGISKCNNVVQKIKSLIEIDDLGA